MLSFVKRWRIVKSIESGGPTPRSLAKTMEQSPELRAYADSMTRVHEGLSAPDATHAMSASRARPDFVARVLNEIDTDASLAMNDGEETSPAAWSEPIRFVRPLGLAAAVVLFSGLSVVVIRPWDARPAIEVTGEFSSLISFFQPLSEETMGQWFDQSLADEMDALNQDAQDMTRGMLEGIPGAGLLGRNQGDEPG